MTLIIISIINSKTEGRKLDSKIVLTKCNDDKISDVLSKKVDFLINILKFELD